jgi:hypothetical protein
MYVKCTYKIFEDKKLLVKRYLGVISKDDLISINNNIINDVNYDPNMDVINDIRDAKFDFTVKDIKNFSSYTKAIGRMNGNRKVAFWTDTPDQTVFTILLDLYKIDKNIKIAAFTTLNAILHWIKISAKDSVMITDWFINVKKSCKNSDRV